MQCTATRKVTGEQCQRFAISGGNVCWVHGGAAPQVRAAALRRIHSLVDPALEILAEAMAAGPTPEGVRAARDVLDRAGYKAPEKITFEKKDEAADALEAIMGELVSLSERERAAPDSLETKP